ncbi:MAG: hypothetical protein U1G08_05235 [Verrucomicrobiota bacterium]
MRIQSFRNGSNGILIRSLLIAVALLSVSTHAESDLDPPEVISTSVNPGRVDTTDGPKDVEVVVRLRDTLSGLARYGSPFSESLVPLTVLLRPEVTAVSPQSLVATLSSVPALNGAALNPYEAEYRGVLTVPPGTQPGGWVLANFGVQDMAGNFQGYDSTGLSGLGFVPARLEVVGVGDAQPPRIESIEFSTNRVDVSEHSQTVRILLRIRDDGSGVALDQYSTVLSFRGELTGSTVAPFSGPNSWQRIEGDAQNGVYAFDVEFGQYFAPSDIYHLQPVQIRDRVGNLSVLTPNEAELRGFPTTIRVDPGSGVPPGLQPPEFVAIKFATGSLDTSDAAVPMTVEVDVRDDNEGALSASVLWVGPLGKHRVQLYGFRPPGGLPAITCSGLFPAHCEAGEWRLQTLGLRDRFGNAVSVSGAELEQRGMPTRIVVTTSPRLHVDRGDGTTVAWWRRVPGRYHVQTSRNLQAWTDLPAPVIVVGDENVAVLRAESVAAEDLFFRLIRE